VIEAGSVEAVPALAVRDLSVRLPRRGKPPVELVRGVSFEVARGAAVGLVGESGAGKSLTCYALLGLTKHSGLASSGEVRLGGDVISACSERELQHVRGRRISIVFQEPSVSLDPAFTVGSQIAEIYRWHTGCTRRDAWARAVECLRLAGVPDPARRAEEYPHTLSGGLRQRAMIAMAIACEPEVLIADEATTALDVTIQAQILGLLRELRERLGMALVIVTHDLGVVADSCDQVVVMYGGEVVESGPVDEVFRRPTHPYTQGLLDAVPAVDATTETALTGIPGVVPAPDAEIDGCRFGPRCDHRDQPCVVGPLRLLPSGRHQQSRCCRWQDLRLPGVRTA
jgi:oligopeptide/dipeptide ABC transporter ATP-binding protein